MSDQGFQGGRGPLTAPPQDYKDPYDQHSQFHTIMRRLEGSSVGLSPGLPQPPRSDRGAPSPKVVVGGQTARSRPPARPRARDGGPLPAAGPGNTADPSAPRLAGAAESVQRQGKLVTLFGCKGGVGNTFVGINLSVALSRTHNVCLVDMDLQMGDALVSMNMEGRCAISHIIRDIRNEGEIFNPRSILDRHDASGVYVLSQIHCLEELDLLKPAEMAKLYAFMKQRFPFIVVDGLRSFDDNSMVILDAADTVLLVVTQDVPSVRAAGRSMEIFRRLGYGEDKVAVVVNRYYRKALITPEYIAMSLKTERVHTIRHDFQTAIKSLNEGVPLHLLAPQARITGDVDALADSLRDKSGASASRGGGLFSKLAFWKG